MNGTKADLRHDLEKRLQFEALLADISTRFINLPGEKIDSLIEDSQGRVCECLGLELSSLWQWTNEPPRALVLTHLHSPPDFERPGKINGAEVFPWQYQKLLQGEILAFSTKDMPPEAAQDYESCRYFGIKSSVVIPLATGGEPLIGVLAFNTLQEERTWAAETVNQLELTAQIFCNALSRKKSDSILQENQVRLSTAIDVAGLGFYEMNKNLEVSFLDNHGRSLLGLRPEDEKRGREFWLAHIHPEDLPAILERSRLMLEEDVNLFSTEYRYLHPGRGMIWLHHHSRVMERDADGRMIRIIGAMQDITEHKLKEEKIRESETVLKNNQKDLQRLAGKLISAQEEELRHLSRELHDDLSQRLALLAIEAGRLENQSEILAHALPEEFLLEISHIKEQLINISGDVHRISRQLHPTILDDLGLIKAIQSECAALQLRENIEIVFRPEDIPDTIPNNISLCLYRVIQEALKNIIRHSGAEHCEISLCTENDVLLLTIQDKGRGFDPAEVRNKPGLGLSSMRERVQLVLGHLGINSLPGKGTVIKVIIPLNRGEA